MDCKPPGSSVHGQEYWNGLPFSDLGIEPASIVSPVLVGGFLTAESHEKYIIFIMKVKVKSLSRVGLFATPWNIA